MKSAKRVLAVLIAMMMIVGTCAVAASAAVQDQIDAATSQYTLPGQTIGSIVIDGKDNFVLDLNGYELLGDYGEPAITIVNSNNVTIRNGYVTSRFADEKRPLKVIEGLKNGDAPSGIVVTGGTATLEGVRVDAGRTPIFVKKGWEIPAGSGIQVNGNAVVTLKQVSAIGGDYAIYNSAGQVIVEDALLVGAFAAALKPANVVKAEGTEEKVNAADRILGVLNDGINVDPDEKELIDTFLGDRINIYTKSIEDKAPVTVTNGKKVEVEASVISHLWTMEAAGTKKTDCSYKYVPEYLKLENGTTYALDANGKASITGEPNVTENAEILYRLEFEVADDIKDLINIYKNADAYWAKIPAKVDDAWRGTMPKYNEYVNKAAEAFDAIFNLIGRVYEATEGKTDLTKNPKYMAVLNDLFELGGSTIQKNFLLGDKVPGYDRLKNDCYSVFDDIANNVPNASVDANGKYNFDGVDEGATPLYVYGVLDKIDLILNDMDEMVAVFDNENTWRDDFYWFYANLQNVIDMIPEVNRILKNLQTDIAALDVGEALDILNGITVRLDGEDKTITVLLREGIEILDQVEEELPKLYDNENYAAIMDFLDGKDAEWVKACMDKALYMYHNRDTYVNLDSLLLEGGKFAKGYVVYGKIDLTEVNTGAVKIKVTIGGTTDNDTGVTIALDGDEEAVESGTTYMFYDTATLTANAAGVDEFLYWVNAETNRILTTEPTLTFNTKIDRDIEAVFVPTSYAFFDADTSEVVICDNANATFTNNSGAIAGTFEYEPVAEGLVSMVDQVIAEPYLPGYTFDSWPYADGDAINMVDAAADSNNKYNTGNSVFATMDSWYDEAGYALPVRTNSNSVIVIAKFTEGNPNAMVTFTDRAANTIYDAEMPYGYTVTVTAAGDNFSYWRDVNTGDIVCFDKTFTYQSISNVTDKTVSKNFEAIYGASYAAPCASRIAFSTDNGEKINLYFQRAVKEGENMTTSGIIYKFDSSAGLNMDNVGNELDPVYKGTSKRTDRVGTYILGISKDKCNGHSKIYAIPYVEIDGQTYPGRMVTIDV